MKTKLSVLASLVVLTGLLVSCDELLNLVKFSSGDYEVYFTMNPLEAGSHVIDADTVTTSLEESLKDNGVDNFDDISSIELKNASIQIISGEENFDKLDAIKIYMGSLDEPDVELCWYTEIPKGVDELSLSMAGVNLKSYFDASNFWVRCEAVLNEAVPEVVEFKSILEFEIAL